MKRGWVQGPEVVVSVVGFRKSRVPIRGLSTEDAVLFSLWLRIWGMAKL